MPFVAPISAYSPDDGWTECLLVMEDPGVCVWDEETQTAVPLGQDGDGYLIAGPSDQPVVSLDLGEPYKTPDGGR